MNKSSLILLLILVGFKAQAQFQIVFNDSLNTKSNSIEVFGNYNVGSNAVTNTFINKFYLKSYIDDNLKNSVFKHLDDMNSVGGDMNYGFTYTRFKNDSIGLWGMKNTGYYVSLKNREHVNGRFSHDLFKLFFNGNRDYKDTTAVLSDFNYNAITYQQIEFGLIKKLTINQNKYMIGFGLAGLNGQEHLSVLAGKTTMYTQEDGEYIDFTSDLIINRSDTAKAKKKYGVTNGMGVSSHLFFSYSSPAGSNLKLEISDLGFISWNKKAITTKLDTSFRFEGVEVNNIFNFEDPVYSDVPSDSGYIANFLQRTTQGSYATFLPALIELSYDRKVDNYTFLTGIKYRLNANYIPFVFMGGAYNFNPTFYVSANIGYGGYAELNLGLELAKGFNNGFTLLAGSQYVYGYIVPSMGTSQGAYISLKQNF